jgi:tRNA (guanine-N7-)-methyltransferase
MLLMIQKKFKENWNTVFENKNPIHIEIGMGKGKFIVTLAKQNPEINFIGIEKYSSVLLRAVQKLQDEENDLRNLRLICIDAKEIEDVFGMEEIKKLYLNFSDPWPKDRHAKRRLTSKEFLKRYESIIERNGLIEFKTDNKILFDFSLEEYKKSNWELNAVSFDLHNDASLNRDNVMTEYETKFSQMGNLIFKMILKLCREN